MPQLIQAFFTARVNLGFWCSLFSRTNLTSRPHSVTSFVINLHIVLRLVWANERMASPTRSDRSEHESDPEVSGNEMSELANSLVASQEAMTVLGSALADQVVGALQAQGIVPSQDQLVGGLPTMRTCGLPYHTMVRGFGALISAHAQIQQGTV